ncbi:hypothetical protein [Peptoclostridium acidaminophilum]|uniref:hypothetical protein n=1 Tax=Peptoclostridium acidaminophilum TaxID=1731 RepID=UPI001FA7E1D2|nr:hypothetical protein [Peptoclostridium acidaminophilum]
MRKLTTPKKKFDNSRGSYTEVPRKTGSAVFMHCMTSYGVNRNRQGNTVGNRRLWRITVLERDSRPARSGEISSASSTQSVYR